MSFRAAVLSVLATMALANNIHDRGYYEAKFFNWLAQFKTQPRDGEHFVHMLQNFANNDDIIETHNKGNSTFTLGHNQFSHLSLDEWRQEVRLGLAKPDEKATKIHAAPADISTLPDSVDWRPAGAVTPVKDQGQCGSCWSFSTTGALEGAYFIKNKELVSLSEQDFVDCDTLSNHFGRDHGCNGGLMDNAFGWATRNGGVCTEAAYPYVSGTTKKAGTCNENGCQKYAAPIDFTDVTVNSDAAMMSALAQQPVSVAIEADQSAFQLYKSGVFTAPCGTNLDHGVLAVGYGTLDGNDYYIVKNSWSSSWGLDGYILLKRGGDTQAQGQCGVLMAASFPNL